ncbi:MAG TPA: cytochrome P450 [Rubrobacteraceae bacterium]|nr:cytochrome P450 [Rubrobacteraceae bacterium]
MSELPHVDSFDPEDKDGLLSPAKRENSAATGAANQQASEPVELDIADPNFMADAYDTYADLRAKGPVTRVRFAGGAEEAASEDSGEQRGFFGNQETFFVTHYDEVVATLLDRRFSVDPRSGMTAEQVEQQEAQTPEEFRLLSRSIISIDPPDHTRLRKLVQPSFTGRGIQALRGSIQQVVDDLLDEAERDAAERGEAAPDRRMDLIEAFAYPFPVTVISDMLGIPREDRETIRGWTEDLLRVDRGRMDEEVRAGIREFIDYLTELFERKRLAPADDMISRLVHAEEDGDVLDEDEVLATVFLMFLAGHVTTVNLVGNGVVALLTHPGQLAKLKADPGLAKGVVEETLRYWGPVDFIGRRIAREDVEVGGTVIPAGEQATVSLASANRDPERFADPDVFDITRADANRHVAFGKGIHVCLGAPLARVEGQVAFDTLFRRYPDLRLAVPAEEVRWGGSFLRGFARLPVLF